MKNPTAKAAKFAVVALAIPLFGGFATYAAAQVSTKPAPQVVIPGGPATDDKGGVKVKTVSDDPANHDANDNKINDDKANDDKGVVKTKTGSDDPAGHDANDDNGGTTKVSDDPAGHDANDVNDDNGVDATTSTISTTPTTVDDHGGTGVRTTLPTLPTTPTTVDDHGGSHNGGHSSDG